MDSLLRTRVGRAELSACIKLAEAEELVSAGNIEEKIMPVDGYFPEYPVWNSDNEDTDRLLHNGNPVRIKPSETGDAEFVRIYDSEGAFIGVFRKTEGDIYAPRKMFYRRGDR